MNTTREKFIELLKSNEFERTDLSLNEAKELIRNSYSFIPNVDLDIFMDVFSNDDKLIFGESALCTGDISNFIAKNSYEPNKTYEYFEDECNMIDDCGWNDEPMFYMDLYIIDDIAVINGYSTLGDDCSFVLYKKY